MIERKADEYLGPGRYGAHLHRVHEVFDPDQVLVVDFDLLVADPAGVYRAVCRHIGVDEVVPTDVGRTRNQAYSVRSPRLRRQMLRFGLWRRLPFGLGFRLDQWNRIPFRTPPMPTDMRHRLRDWYADDTRRLEAILGRPVSWSPSLQQAEQTKQSGPRP